MSTTQTTTGTGLGGRRTAIVTCSMNGIGLGIAHALAGAGYNVMLNGFGSVLETETLRSSMEAQYGVDVAYNPGDMRRASDVRDMVLSTVRVLGSVDVLVNNTRVMYTAPLEYFSHQDWDQTLAATLSAAFHATKAALPYMKNRGWGRIINIGSAHGLAGAADKAADVAAHHGLVGLTMVAAIETARDNTGITANAICPGWICTPLVASQLVGHTPQDEMQRCVGENQPLRRFPTPEYIGALVVQLCSDAAAMTTGNVISVDGGWPAQGPGGVGYSGWG